MIKKQFTASARRARNIIWNAAGRYDFEPPFMAFYANGVPDHYFNMMVGLAEKWLDLPRLVTYFESYGADRRSEEFDDLLWIGLENCLYEKELPTRPIPTSLRAARARQFFAEQGNLSRQQMEYQSMLVYTQQEARFAPLADKHAPLLSPREKRMADALRFSGDLDTDGVIRAMQAFLQEFFHYTGTPVRAASRGPVSVLRHLLRHEHRRVDRLLVRTGTGEGDHPRAVTLGHDGLGRHMAPTEEDEAYIRAVFGQSSISDGERRVLENDLCVGEDADCRLWITNGTGTDPHHREAAEVAAVRAAQQKKSEQYFTEHASALQHAVKALSARLETVFSSYFKHLPEPALAGRIAPEKAWRLPVLQDARVFTKDGEETEPELFVDLLLDASQSRMNAQEIIAAQSFVVAESLEKLHIPVRVTAFASLRGHTILTTLKAPGKRGARGVTRFTAGGWNRDSLALKALGHLDDEPLLRGRKRLLLILTDANPNDSTPLSSTDRLLPREYEGDAAVRATEAAVRQLAASGIRTGAVFHGGTAHMADLGRIYGQHYVRIRRIGDLSQGISDLLLKLMRE